MTPAAALAEAERAADEGLDGVFAYDHVWPMGSPERPAIAPFEVLATVAVRHPSLVVGPLVARVGLVADDVLLGQLRALRVVADGRIVAALGTGDKLSREENLAYGIGVAAPDERRASLLRDRFGARRRGHRGVDRQRGCGDEGSRGGGRVHAQPVGRDTSCGRRGRAVLDGELGWTGARRATATATRRGPSALLDDLERAGATWAVFGSPATVDAVARVRRRRDYATA